MRRRGPSPLCLPQVLQKLKPEDKELLGKPLMKRVMQSWLPAADALLEMMIWWVLLICWLAGRLPAAEWLLTSFCCPALVLPGLRAWGSMRAAPRRGQRHGGPAPAP